MRKRWHLYLVVCVVLLMSTAILAQADCPAIVQQALESTAQDCKDTGRNQVCYGNTIMSIDFRLGYEIEDFRPGDLMNLQGVAFMRLEPMDTASDIWGVALMKVQANLPDTLPGQNVTFMLFGDVEVENGVGRDDQPLQAFYFKTGLNDAPCTEAPDSGILVQSPEGVTSVTFETNGARVTLLGETATVFMQADAGSDDGDGFMQVSVIQGEAEVESNGEVVVIPQGAKGDVPLDKTFVASDVPFAPVPYEAEVVNALPVAHLEQEITVSAPLTTDEVDAFISVCQVQAASQGIIVRVGPGTHRGILRSLPVEQAVAVTGQHTLDDGSVWWKLDLAPQAWVTQADVNATGDCSGVAIVQAPPIILPQATLVPTAVPIVPTNIALPGDSAPPPPPSGSGDSAPPPPPTNVPIITHLEAACGASRWTLFNDGTTAISGIPWVAEELNVTWNVIASGASGTIQPGGSQELFQAGGGPYQKRLTANGDTLYC